RRRRGQVDAEVTGQDLHRFTASPRRALLQALAGGSRLNLPGKAPDERPSRRLVVVAVGREGKIIQKNMRALPALLAVTFRETSLHQGVGLMASGQLSTTLRQLCRLTDAAQAGDLSDAELLERFASRQEEAAFAALVRRHAPMVLSVCRR